MLANTIRIFLSISGALLIALNLILIRAQRQADWQRPLLVMGLLCLVPYFFERRRLRDFVLFAVPVIALSSSTPATGLAHSAA
jgi:hypothetical protein